MKHSEYRYGLEPYGGPATRYTCPGCGHRRAFTRYKDNRTGLHLPDEYGICDRADQCGYQLSPYHKGASGESYADQIREQERGERAYTPRPATPKFKLKPTVSQPIHELPQEIRQQSLGQYDQNQFAKLLQRHFGGGEADELLARFQIGTSAYWEGATVFWFVDEQGRTRGGQVALFEPDGHTAKRPGRDGELKRCTGWVHTALMERHRQQGKTIPAWLTTYAKEGDKAPCLFGMPQLVTAPPIQPVAVVEAPKTAVLCSRQFPKFVWLAVGAKSWLNAERLAPLKGRAITLFPDGGAYEDWSQKADKLRGDGFQIQVSDYIERHASPEQLRSGYDPADLFLEQAQHYGYPYSWGWPPAHNATTSPFQ